MKHIVVIDDDHKLRNLLSDYLSQYAFRVTAVKNKYELGKVLAGEASDLFIVDLNLGREDGLDIVRNLALETEIPIIILSGDRLAERDKVIGLELGACHYVTKPFGLRELLARIRAALRNEPRLAVSSKQKIYRFGRWTLDGDAKILASVTGEESTVTNGELRLLLAFLRAPRQVLTREHLLAETRVYDEEIYDRSVDVLILRIRRKLESDPSNPEFILTRRGVGYYLNSDVTIQNNLE